MKRLLPPTLVAILLLLMTILKFWLPLGAFLPDQTADILGASVTLTGLAVLLGAAYQFSKAQTNINTFKEPTVLVENGLFKYTRNPMYLGFFLITVGAALLINDLTSLIGPLIFFSAAHFWYIPYEEKTAARIFGPSYDAYKARVRRWI